MLCQSCIYVATFILFAKGCPVDEVEGAECPEVALTQVCLDRFVFHGVFYRRLVLCWLLRPSSVLVQSWTTEALSSLLAGFRQYGSW